MAQRKLMGEIDKILKKVNEGSAEFDQILEKLQQAPTQNQKEKLEQDLKKSIKKLQRYRDQIKTWIQGNQIKDKKLLLESRKRIERHMETFKICEREMKTKAYSKEGLSQVRDEDPAADTKKWINDALSDIQLQYEQFQSEKDDLVAKKKKTTAERERELELDAMIHRHRFHEEKLETVLRLLENEEIDFEDVEETAHDAVRNYLEYYNDPDYFHDEELYDKLIPDDEGIKVHTLLSERRSGDDSDLSSSDSDDGEADSAEAESAPLSLPTKSDNAVLATAPAAALAPAPVQLAPTPQNPPAASSAVPTAAPKSKSGAAAASVSLAAQPARPSVQSVPAQTTLTSSVAQTPPPGITSPGPAADSHPDGRRGGRSGGPDKAAIANSSPTPVVAAPAAAVTAVPPAAAMGASRSSTSARADEVGGADRQRDVMAQFQCSLRHMPLAVDSERPRPRGGTAKPKSMPPYFPSQRLSLAANPASVEKFDTDTLFYMFYFMQGSYEQSLAAAELKKQSWRYHKKYQTWFQRYEEPKEVTPEYETGTFVYFDFESGWVQRQKREFRFEYLFTE